MSNYDRDSSYSRSNRPFIHNRDDDRLSRSSRQTSHLENDRYRHDRYRVPDNDQRYIDSPSTSNRRVVLDDHRSARYYADQLRTVEARESPYMSSYSNSYRSDRNDRWDYRGYEVSGGGGGGGGGWSGGLSSARGASESAEEFTKPLKLAETALSDAPKAEGMNSAPQTSQKDLIVDLSTSRDVEQTSGETQHNIVSQVSYEIKSTPETNTTPPMDNEHSTENESFTEDFADCDSDSGDTGNEEDTYDQLWNRLRALEIDRMTIPLLGSARDELIDRVMDEFWVIFSTTWSSHASQHARHSSQEAEPGGSEIETSNGRSSQVNHRKRLRFDDEDPDGTRERDSQPPNNEFTRSDDLNLSLRLACPFRKHNPRQYNVFSHRICALSHWPSIARVKEHLYRCHRMAIHCKRCWRIFKSEEQLDMHITVEAADICHLQSGTPPVGITPDIERKLRSRKKSRPNQTERDRWIAIYQLLFPNVPNAEIPSPDFDLAHGDVPMSPDSRDLADYEDYARRELPRLVRTNIEEVLRREMQPVEASLVRNLVNTIQECQDRLFRSYFERARDQAPQPATVSSAATDNRETRFNANTTIERNEQQVHTEPSSILQAAFEQPPAVEDMDYGSGFLDFGHREGFLSSSSGNNFNDSAYYTDSICNFPGPCNSCIFNNTFDGQNMGDTNPDTGLAGDGEHEPDQFLTGE